MKTNVTYESVMSYMNESWMSHATKKIRTREPYTLSKKPYTLSQKSPKHCLKRALNTVPKEPYTFSQKGPKHSRKRALNTVSKEP